MTTGKMKRVLKRGRIGPRGFAEKGGKGPDKADMRRTWGRKKTKVKTGWRLVEKS